MKKQREYQIPRSASFKVNEARLSNKRLGLLIIEINSYYEEDDREENNIIITAVKMVGQMELRNPRSSRGEYLLP